MSNDLIYTSILAASFLGLFGAGEILYHVFSVKVELSRKFVHFGTGVLTLFFPVLLTNHWYVLFLCASFLVILELSLRFNLLKSINNIDRKSYGSILYPVAVYSLFMMYDSRGELIYFYLPVMILAISDPLAALVGKKWPIGKYKIFRETKSLMGSTSFFLSAAIIGIFMLYFLNTFNTSNQLLSILIISLVTAVAEAMSQKGFDNLMIPVTAALSMILLQQYNILHL